MDDQKQSIELARWFANQLRGRSVSQQRIMINEEADQVRRVYGDGTEKLLEARNEWSRQAAQGNRIPIPQGREDEAPAHINTLGSETAAGGAAGIAGIGLKILSGKTYDELINDAEKRADKAVKAWQAEEQELRTNPSRKPTKGRAESVEEAYRRAIAEEYDSFVGSSGRNNKKAFNWTKEHPDNSFLAQSLIRHEINTSDLTTKRAAELKERYIELAAESASLSGFDNEVEKFKLRRQAGEEIDKLISTKIPGFGEKPKTQAQTETPPAETVKTEQSEEAPQPQSEKDEAAAAPQQRAEDEDQDQTQNATQESSTQRSKRMQKEAIESLRAEGATSPQTIRGGAIDNAWPEYTPSFPPQPPTTPRQATIPQQPNKAPSLPRVPGRFARNPNTPLSGIQNNLGNVRKIAKIASKAKWFLNPYVLTAAGILIFALLILLIILNLCQITSGIPLRNIWLPVIDRLCGVVNLITPPPLPKGVNITLDWPKEIENGQPITYKITVTYDKSSAINPIEDMTLVDAPNFDHELVSANPTSQLTRGTAPRNEYTWDLSSLQGVDSGNIITYSLEVTVKPTVENQKVENWVYIEGISQTGADTTAGSNSPPTSNTCNGKYKDIMTAIHNDYPTIENTNYGDPICNYSKSNLQAKIQSLDPDNANFWMDIARCESPGNGPNGYSRSSDAWGQFQMRRSFPNPFKQSNIDSEPDRGDVPWQRQIENAIKWNNARAKEGNNFVYWETAYCLCATARHANQPYCADIKRQNLEKSCSTCN